MPDHRVVVVSIPKSGTYLVAELLKTLGYRWTGMHLAESAYTDYTDSSLDEARQDPGRFARNEPLSLSLARIQAGEFAVGHLPFKDDVIQMTAPFKRLYVTRSLRLALISYMRFLQATGRLGAKHLPWYSIPDLRERSCVFLRTTAPYLLMRFYRGMTGWSKFFDAFPVRFEDLTGDAERAARTIESIASFLEVPTPDAPHILRAILESETITKSEGLTQLDDYWSPQAEKLFVEIGGLELAARLGCPAASRLADRAWRAARAA
jgi:hypothetical protein